MTPAGGIIEASNENTIHREYVRWKTRETPFVRAIANDASIRAIDGAYRAWAHARNLHARPGEHRFTGDFWGRRITFFTGLSGTKPIAAEVMIEAALPTEDCVLIERDATSDQDKTQARTFGLVLMLFTRPPGRYVRSVGVTPRGLRVRLEPLIPPAEVDALLDVLIELVSSLTCHAVSRSSSDSATVPGAPG